MRQPGNRKPRQSRGARRPSASSQSPIRLLGQHSVREALRAQRRELVQLLLCDGARGSEIDELTDLARHSGVTCREVDPQELSRGLHPNDRVPRVALDAGPLPELSLQDLARGAPGSRRLIALDGVEDPQNLGAIARVAEGAGVDGLVLTERRSPPLGAAASRASAGALEWLPISRVANLPKGLEQLKAEGFWVVGADADAAESLYEVPDRTLRGDLVIAMGAEGKGLRPLVQRLVDHPIRIPMRGRVSSLNVATACAVVLFELLRRAAPEAPAD